MKDYLANTVRREIVRCNLPKPGAFNFVFHDALAGGVTRSLSPDPHGKSLSSSLLEMKVPDHQREVEHTEGNEPMRARQDRWEHSRSEP